MTLEIWRFNLDNMLFALFPSDCPVLEDLVSGDTILSPARTATYESTVTVTCSLGYKFDAAEYYNMPSVNLVCKEKGIWTYNNKMDIRIPNCKGIWSTPWQKQQSYLWAQRIRVFAVLSVGKQGPEVSSCRQWRLWSDWTDAQADLILCWVHRSFCWFYHAVAHFPLLHCTNLKNLNNWKKCYNCSKSWPVLFYHTVMYQKDANIMANSVDSDQTAPLRAVWSGGPLSSLIESFNCLLQFPEYKWHTRSCFVGFCINFVMFIKPTSFTGNWYSLDKG